MRKVPPVRVRRAEFIVRNFLRPDPAKSLVLQQLGHSGGNGAVKQGQANQHIRVIVEFLKEPTAHVHLDGQLLGALPGQSLGRGLPWLYLAAYKFPEQPPGFVGRPLADQKSVLLPDQGGHHIHRLFLGEHRGGAGEDVDLSLGGEQRDGSGNTVVDVHIPGSIR